MTTTHFINITKDEFDDIKIGDRIIISNEETKLGYITYITETEGDENE